MPRQTVADIIKSTEKGHLSNFGKDFKPLLYNIWNTQESIADILGVDRKYVERTVNGHIGQMSDLTKDFKPLMYNICIG